MTLLIAIVVSVIVVDGDGRPIEGAEVCHSAKRTHFPKTAADGMITVETDAPRIVIRKEGFNSAVRRPDLLKPNARVTLYRPRVMPVCRIEPEQHTDWPPQLRHTVGPNNGSFQPSTPMVWAAASYTENLVELNGNPAIDAKATSPDGRYWRHFGNLGETVSYSGADSNTAHQLDHFIERACQVHVTAQVGDANGKALDGVAIQIQPVNIARDSVVLPSSGIYEGYTASPYVVFRRHGYQAVVVKPAESLRILLQAAPSAPFKRCQPSWETAALRIFQFPTSTPDRSFIDVDYSGHTYSVNTSTGKHSIAHGWGVMWATGFPSNDFVFQSTEYEERTYLLGSVQLSDARGTLKDGTRWRYLGCFGESASYETKDTNAAKQLDAVLDGICLTERRP